MNKILYSATAALLLASCGNTTGWRVEGTIDGAADGQGLAVEAYNAGHWYLLDSIAVDNKGRFEYRSGEPVTSADILRITMPGKGSIHFPVDNGDAIKIKADATTFGTGHRLSGSAMAEAISAIDSTVAATPALVELQRKLTPFIISDTTGLVAYYAVGKAVANKPVFDPDDSFGNRIYGAAAQVYAHYNPLDPRGQALRQAFFEGRRALGKLPEAQAETTVEVPETGIIDIVRYDNRGEKHSLAEVASQGKVVLLSFTDYSMQSSPAYNAILNDLYKLYRDRGLEIYQLAFDADEVEWKEAAMNLPWITVWNSPSDGASVLALYNVGAVPMTYIIDRKGDIGTRITDPTAIAKEVAKYF